MKLTTILKYFLTWQWAIIIITLLSTPLLPLRPNYLGGGPQMYQTNPLLYSRGNFDGVHYTLISGHGYGYAQQAFFPLYPTLIKKLTPLARSAYIAGVTISLSSFFLALVVFTKLVKLDFDTQTTKWTVISLLLFPTSFFFTSVYTEGLFFLLIVTSFYFARTRRWLLAGVLGALAANTRFVGIFLFPALLIEWWQQDKKIKNLIPLLIVPFGLLSYSLYLQKTTGDPLAFYHVQKYFGQLRSEKIILLYQVFWRYVKMVATVNRADPLYLTIVLEAVTGVVFLITSIYSFVKLRLSYALFNLFAYLVPTLTGNFVSLPRYVLVCFPSYLILGRFLSATHPLNRKVLAFSLFVLFFIYLGLFVRGYWVS